MAKEPKPIRYIAEVHPTDKIEAACVAEGMRPDDGTSFWDWVDIPQFAEHTVFKNFADAVAFAKANHKKDCFGGVRIYRQEQVVLKFGPAIRIEWVGDQFDRPDWQLNHVISKRLLNAAERTMPLDRLAVMYPLT